MKLTNRVLGWTRKGEPREKVIGRTMTTKPTGEVVFEEEQPISKAIRVEDYSLNAQLRNGTFANKEMPTYFENNTLNAADNIEGKIQDAEAQIKYEQAKQNAKVKQETKPAGTGSTSTEEQ